MGTVSVHIAGRSYDLACEDGQENRLAALASQVDRETQELARQMGALGESRLLAMAGLMLADKLDEAQSQRADPTALEEARQAIRVAEAARDAALAEAAQARAALNTALAERDAAPAEASPQINLFDEAALGRLDAASDRLESVLDGAEAARGV
jgi:cell division protein ZapA